MSVRIHNYQEEDNNINKRKLKGSELQDLEKVLQARYKEISPYPIKVTCEYEKGHYYVIVSEIRKYFGDENIIMGEIPIVKYLNSIAIRNFAINTDTAKYTDTYTEDNDQLIFDFAEQLIEQTSKEKNLALILDQAYIKNKQLCVSWHIEGYVKKNYSNPQPTLVSGSYTHYFNNYPMSKATMNKCKNEIKCALTRYLETYYQKNY